MGDQAMVDSLKQQAKTVRKEVLTMIHTAGSGHPGGSLSAADIMTALYFHELNIRPEEPKWDGRDRFVLSKGHVCPVLYTCLALRGYFDKEILGTLRREGSILQGASGYEALPRNRYFNRVAGTGNIHSRGHGFESKERWLKLPCVCAGGRR